MQLRNLGERCREQAAKHSGRFPAKWSELEWDDMGGIENTTWDRQFARPTVGQGPGNWDQVDLWSDYRLIPGRTANNSPATVLAIQPLSNHKTGANVYLLMGAPSGGLRQSDWAAARAAADAGMTSPIDRDRVRN